MFTLLPLRELDDLDDLHPWNGGLKWKGLTQVSRQVRREYMPIWTRDTQFRIHILDLNSYLEAFYPLIHTTKPPDAMAAYQGDIVLEINPHIASTTPGDILPFIYLSARCPNVRCRFSNFGHTQYPFLKELNKLLDKTCADKWLRNLDKYQRVVNVWIRQKTKEDDLGGSTHKVVIGILEDYAFEKRSDAGWSMGGDFMDTVTELGLSGMRGWDVTWRVVYEGASM